MAQIPPKNFKAQIRAHWQEHRPALFAQMEAAGTLDANLDTAVALTTEAIEAHIAQAEAKGDDNLEMARLQAWELFRQEWAFLPEEGGEDDEGGEIPDVFLTLELDDEDE
jgi:hypothetical protein